MIFFFNDTATTEIYTLSLHDALPIFGLGGELPQRVLDLVGQVQEELGLPLDLGQRVGHLGRRSEEHTSELQSRQYLVCRLLLEKKKKHLHYESIQHYRNHHVQYTIQS